MSSKKRKPPLVLDMEFGEAMRRFAQTDLSDLPDSVKLNKKRRLKKPTSSRKKA